MSPCPGFSTSQTAPGKQCSEQTKQKRLADFCENGIFRVMLLVASFYFQLLVCSHLSLILVFSWYIFFAHVINKYAIDNIYKLIYLVCMVYNFLIESNTHVHKGYSVNLKNNKEKTFTHVCGTWTVSQAQMVPETYLS